jgi:hypothetical protein
MIKVMPIFVIGVVATMTAGCVNGKTRGETTQSAAAQRDYELLSGNLAVDSRSR